MLAQPLESREVSFELPCHPDLVSLGLSFAVTCFSFAAVFGLAPSLGLAILIAVARRVHSAGRFAFCRTPTRLTLAALMAVALATITPAHALTARRIRAAVTRGISPSPSTVSATATAISTAATAVSATAAAVSTAAAAVSAAGTPGTARTTRATGTAAAPAAVAAAVFGEGDTVIPGSEWNVEVSQEWHNQERQKHHD